MRISSRVLEDTSRTFREDEGIAGVLVRIADGYKRSTYQGVERVLIEVERLRAGTPAETDMITIRIRMWGPQ